MRKEDYDRVYLKSVGNLRRHSCLNWMVPRSMVQQTLSPFDYGPKVCSSDHGPSMYHGDLSFTTNVDIG